MSNEHNWLSELRIKDSDFLTFNSHGIDYSCKYKNFKSNFSRNIERSISDTLTKFMRECNDSVNVGSNSWKDGIPCELLQDGIEKKGKIRLKVIIEFIPDEVEVIQGVEGITDKRSPLDDIRQINL